MLVPLILRKVLDETTCEVFCFAIPLVDVGISVARIEDLGGNAIKRSRDFKIEVRNGLRGCFFDVAVEDASIIPRVSFMEIRLPFRSNRC